MGKGKNLHQLLLRTQKFTPKVRNSRQSSFLHHPLSRSPPEFLHQLGILYTDNAGNAGNFFHLWMALII